jgi:hypothetical protein
MKKALYLIILFFVAISCGDDGLTDTSTKAQEFSDVVTSGRWKITYFFDTDKEETDNFVGYTFDFGSGGTVNAINGPLSHPGSWSVTGEGDSKDYEDLDFNISFSAPPDFAELSEDWEIVTVSNLKISLRHVSGGDGSTDLLTFEKN